MAMSGGGAAEIRDLLLKAIDEKGADYVYPSALREEYDTCRYFTPDGAPACIIGHVLAYKGVEATHEIEGQSAHDVLQQYWPEPLPDAVLIAATQAQSTQDCGETWAQALEEYDQVYAQERDASPHVEPDPGSGVEGIAT